MKQSQRTSDRLRNQADPLYLSMFLHLYFGVQLESGI